MWKLTAKLKYGYIEMICDYPLFEIEKMLEQGVNILSYETERLK